MTRGAETFAPQDGHTVRMYTCGPTVYNPAHLGNFRTFLFEDLLRRTLRLAGWKVLQVMNLTDVDDKIIKRADKAGVTITEITEPVTASFQKDREFLRIESAEVYPKATGHIGEMIALVQQLMEKGLAYQAEDGSVYFAIARFPGYGRLSRLDTRDIKPGARVIAGRLQQRRRRDFALWKAAKPEDERTAAAWDSPWGRGRPGWHLECSAMAMRYLGDTLDIHGGGVDLIFPHHEDEIAQSEGATRRTLSRFWCHGEFLLTDGAKMAKRIGNVMTWATCASPVSVPPRCGISFSRRTTANSLTSPKTRSKPRSARCAELVSSPHDSPPQPTALRDSRKPPTHSNEMPKRPSSMISTRRKPSPPCSISSAAPMASSTRRPKPIVRRPRTRTHRVRNRQRSPRHRTRCPSRRPTSRVLDRCPTCQSRQARARRDFATADAHPPRTRCPRHRHRRHATRHQMEEGAVTGDSTRVPRLTASKAVSMLHVSRKNAVC